MVNGWGWYVAAAGCALPAYILIIVARAFRMRHGAAARGTSTVSCAEIASYGGQPVRCEIKGEAVPGPAGMLTAPLSGTPCVWFRTTIEERRDREDADGGHTRTVHRLIHRELPPSPFGVRDATGAVLVCGEDPADFTIDGVPQVMSKSVTASEVRRGEFEDRFGLNLQRSVGGVGLLIGPDGFRISEWALPAGQQLHVLGLGSNDASAGPVVRKPSEEPYIVSTLTGEEVVGRSGPAAAILTTLTVVLFCAASTLLAAGLIQTLA